VRAFPIPTSYEGVPGKSLKAVKTDGSFFVSLPDFSQDRVIASFGGAGDFSFTLHQRDGVPVFELTPSGAEPNQRRIAVSSRYPAEQAFDLGPRR
jgi:hypothetical protein